MTFLTNSWAILAEEEVEDESQDNVLVKKYGWA